MTKRMKMWAGFTLLELLIVVIIVGVLASLALPRFFRGVERARWAEAKSMLGALRGAQIRYYAENGDYTGSLSNLDVEIVDMDPVALGTQGRYFTFYVTMSAPTQIAVATRTSTQSAGFTGQGMNIGVDGDFSYSAGVPAWLR